MEVVAAAVGLEQDGNFANNSKQEIAVDIEEIADAGETLVCASEPGKTWKSTEE